MALNTEEVLELKQCKSDTKAIHFACFKSLLDTFEKEGAIAEKYTTFTDAALQVTLKH